MRQRLMVGLAVLAALAGCASNPVARLAPSPTPSPAAAASPDPKLVGGWQVTSAQRRGQSVIRADDSTESGFEFASNGNVVVTDQADTTVRYRTEHGYLSLIYPDGEYSSYSGGSRATIRILTLMEHLEDVPQMRYVVTGQILVLSTARYSLTLRRGDPHRPIFTPHPSLSPSTDRRSAPTAHRS